MSNSHANAGGNDSILLIDDDSELVELVSEYLIREGFRVEAAADGERGLQLVQQNAYVLVVLDVMLPGLGGFEVLRRIRATSGVPVVMLTARRDEVDRVLGLESGADDYLAKPFSPRELVARIRAVMRRLHPEARDPAHLENCEPKKIIAGDLEVDPRARAVRVRGMPCELTAVEFDLLELMLRSEGRVITRQAIARGVLDRPLMRMDRSVDVHMSNLRKKLGPHPDGSERIKTIRGVGYVHVPPPFE